MLVKISVDAIDVSKMGFFSNFAKYLKRHRITLKNLLDLNYF